ncbi:hypothetical protein [Qaidamihabitans albus]|uniref:hypothetical protein n=1 Tax=Qaidamihabitans albus TaxID=2795733 RepID=UPI0018F1C73B|nr:hypothetical protein [Qaidamihabitans albus]
MLTVAFVLAVAAVLIGLGRAVRLPQPAPALLTDTEPWFARDLLAGLLVLREISLAHAERLERYTDEMSGRRRVPHA